MIGCNLLKHKLKMKNKSIKKNLQEFILKTLESRTDFITSKDISEMFNSVTGYKTDASSIRLAVHEIRANKISPIIASTRGYKIATTKREIQEQTKRLEEMVFEIMDALAGMASMAESLKFNFEVKKEKKQQFAIYSPIFEQILAEIENGGKILEVLKKYNVSYQKISKEDKIKMRQIRFKNPIPIQMKREKQNGKQNQINSELVTTAVSKKRGRKKHTINFSDVADKFFEELKKGRTRGELLLEYNIGYQTLTADDKIKIRQIKYPNLVPLQLRRNIQNT
jgi:hypothetical protein